MGRCAVKIFGWGWEMSWPDDAGTQAQQVNVETAHFHAFLQAKNNTF